MLPPYREFSVVCKLMILYGIDLPYGFWKWVTDALPGLGSQGGGDGPLVSIVRMSKSTNR
jgi:hypothetical protein